ncbi:MAG: outer rane autotransporter barrel domain [Tardiphaga sp.]|nr:outer rane autotransporter barrel domain [Tardiphaga sp.]
MGKLANRRAVAGVTLSFAVAGAITASTAGLASAQTAFTSIQAFGDSYVDNGNLFRLTGQPFPAAYPTGRFSGGTNFVDTASQLLGIPQSNYAIGGATAGPTNVVGPGIPGFFQEWTGFVASGRSIAPNDLVIINIGGNDARRYYQTGGSLAGATAAATTSATQAIAGVNALVGVGARTIAFGIGDVSGLPEANGVPAAAIGSAFSQSYNAQVQTALAAIARTGVRVEVVDIAAVGARVNANPAAFGLTFAGACPLACIGNPALQNQYQFYFDQVHLTSAGFAILGQYFVNRINAPLTIAPQADLAMTSVMGFASTLYGKLDQFREISGYGAGGAMNAYAAAPGALYTKAPPPRLAAYNPWSFYLQANGGVSDRSSTATSTGFNLDSIGGTIGTEYRVSANGFIGAAFDYSNPKARLLNNAGTIDANAYQFGVYGSWVNANFFAQALATIGVQDYRNTRPGVIDAITSRPDGNSIVVGGKAGYLFNAGAVQLGPIGGLTYARVRLNGYTEAGDAALTLAVGTQTAEALVGSVGAQFRAPLLINGRVISPYINLTMEDDLIGTGRIIQYGATSAPLIVNNWSIANGSQRIYGRVSGGVLAPLSSTVALTANLSRTFARQGGDDFYGNGGLKISF